MIPLVDVRYQRNRNKIVNQSPPWDDRFLALPGIPKLLARLDLLIDPCKRCELSEMGQHLFYAPSELDILVP